MPRKDGLTFEQAERQYGPRLDIAGVVRGAAEIARSWGARFTLILPDDQGNIHHLRGLRAFDLAETAK